MRSARSKRPAVRRVYGWMPTLAISAPLGLTWLATAALATAPIKGGRYAGKWSTGSRKGDRYVAFNVDDQGRAFVSDPRLVFEGSEFDGAPVASWGCGISAGPSAAMSQGRSWPRVK
jgi:hypothetical protein